MCESAERPGGALNMGGGRRRVYGRGGGDHVKLEVVNCDASLWPWTEKVSSRVLKRVRG